MRPAFATNLRSHSLAALIALALAEPVHAQFTFNFDRSGAPIVPSIANQTCNAGGGGGMGGMGGMGGCDGTRFIQEIVTIEGTDYYHVIVGDETDDFGTEFYIRTVPSGVCWWGCGAGSRVGGMGGGMGGGPAPLSASSGSATNDMNPLDPSNNGTGRPDQVAVRMFINTPEITQEFLKATESQKPIITQTISTPEITMDFALDMSNSDYNTMGTPGTLSLTQTLTIPDLPNPGNNPVTGEPLPGSANFDINNLGETANVQITGGRFTYSPGSGDGGSLGTYTYFADSFDVYNVDWVSYCDPAQNPASNCETFGRARGGMMGGGMGGGTGATGGGTTSGGGMGGMGGAVATTTTTVNTTTTTTFTSGTTTTLFNTSTTSTSTTTTFTTTTTTTVGGGGMGGMGGM